MKPINSIVRNKLFAFFLFICVTVCAAIPLNTIPSGAVTTDTKINLKYTVNSDSITLTWNKITHEKGVKGYYVYRATTSGGQTILPETDFWITGTSYVDKKVTPGTTYYYIVKPVLSDGYTGKASNEVKVYYQGGTSYSITLKAKVNTGNITLEWDVNGDRSNILGYYVYRATRSGKQTDLPETDFWVTGRSYKDNKVEPGTTYYYIVKPVLKDKTVGKPSNEVSAKCQRIYGTISMTLGERKMIVNGKKVDIDPGKNTVPVLKNARTMLPIRALIEAMGGTVDYVSGEQKVTVKWGGKTVCVWIGKTTFTVDGVKKTMDVAPYFSETGRTMLPMRFIIENLGCDISWDGETYTATVSYLLNHDDNYPQTPPDDSDESWAGIWFTNRGKLKITQNGIYVEGTYGNGNEIEGIISGDKLIGTYNEKGASGNLEFVISSDGESFKGKYSQKSKSSKREWQNWDGQREEDNFIKYLRKLDKPADFSGTWSIKSIGKLNIEQKNNRITGTLGSKERITGTVSNNKLTGTYTKGNKTFNIEIYMLEGNKRIIGHYGDSDTAMQNWSEFTGEIHKNSNDKPDRNKEKLNQH
ncbi:MAG: hypothetical protein GX236_12870 [Clostridiaceae bacterium]|mgnify:CR=1 FL=1|jgi:hypothetical protein|nr:hypothetical protein [Clostridiaceae bacterium]